MKSFLLFAGLTGIALWAIGLGHDARLIITGVGVGWLFMLPVLVVGWLIMKSLIRAVIGQQPSQQTWHISHNDYSNNTTTQNLWISGTDTSQLADSRPMLIGNE